MQKSHILIIVLLVAALLVLVVVARQMTTDKEESPELADRLETARTHLEEGKYTEALADLEAAVEQDPGDSEAHFLLGQDGNRARSRERRCASQPGCHLLPVAGPRLCHRRIPDRSRVGP